MIDLKSAVAKAIEFIRDAYSDSELLDLKLEEVERSENERYWHITLGFTRKMKQGLGSTNTSLDYLAKQQASYFAVRVYKVLEVNAETGNIQSMKIRELE